MKGIELIQHEGCAVTLLHLAGTKPDESIGVIREAQAHLSLQSPKSVLLLTDVTDVVFNQASMAALQEFSRVNTPRIAASAVVGADGLRSVALQTIALLTGRHIRACETREEALEWLTSQAPAPRGRAL